MPKPTPATADAAPPRRRAAGAYLLPPLAADELDRLRRRLVYEVSGGGASALVLAEPPAALTIGREGSRSQIDRTDDELARLGLTPAYQARGGGVHLTGPGQVLLLAVTPHGPGCPTAARLVAIWADLTAGIAAGFGLAPDPRPAGCRRVTLRGRPFAQFGLTIRGGAAVAELAVNVAPDLELFRGLELDGHARPMTSLARESTVPVGAGAVRARLLELAGESLELGPVHTVTSAPFLWPPKVHAKQPATR